MILKTILNSASMFAGKVNVFEIGIQSFNSIDEKVSNTEVTTAGSPLEYS